MKKQSRLNVSVDAQVIEAAKAYARQHGLSVSALVEAYLSSLLVSEGDPVVRDVHARLVAQGFSGGDECDVEPLRERHLAEKYR